MTCGFNARGATFSGNKDECHRNPAPSRRSRQGRFQPAHADDNCRAITQRSPKNGGAYRNKLPLIYSQACPLLFGRRKGPFGEQNLVT
mmetsp:Transcript_7790/g.23548  ORF Transcript_7790/g.23548 Transcript_7790/m.23548 type:complete len:88 (-) Transcript_7790:331-594(-)